MLKYMSRRVKMRRQRRSHLGGPEGMRYRERGYGGRVVITRAARRAKCA